MDREHFDAAIDRLRQRKPFRPFTIDMVNGDRLEVDHPRAIAVQEGVGVFLGLNGVVHYLDYHGVTQVRDDIESKTPVENGEG